MKLNEGEIRIYYKVKGGISIDLDDFFHASMKLIGYKFYASGTEMDTLVRNLCFEKKEVK